MADTKLSALTELAATPANDDEVYIRDVSEAASAESKRITVTNLLAGATGASIAAGTYAGNNANNRQIAVGFKCSLIILTDQSNEYWICFDAAYNLRMLDTPTLNMASADCLLHATDGFVVDQSFANATGTTYYYWAISE